MKHRKKKLVPTFFGFDSYGCEHEKFYCYYEEAVWDKYGLHYILRDDTGRMEKIHLKGKRYSKPPYAFISYEKMLNQTEKYARAVQVASNAGDIRKKAIYLILDLDEEGNLLADPCSFDGYVSARGSKFNITGDGSCDGKKWFKLTEKDKHLVFPNISKAAFYIEKHYSADACFHYLKSLS